MKNTEMERIRRGEGLLPLTDSQDGLRPWRNAGVDNPELESFYEKYWMVPSIIISVLSIVLDVIVIVSR